MTLLLALLLPLIVFAALDALNRTMAAAVASAVACALLEFLVMYRALGHADPISTLTLVLFVVLGVTSVTLDDRRYFKLQPALITVISAGFLGYLQFLGQPAVERYLPLLKEAAPASMAAYLQDRVFLTALDRLFDWLVIVLLGYGGLIAYAALRWRQGTWLLVNVLGPWIIAAVMALVMMVSMLR